jgi:predicted transcriptional regulator
MHGKDIRHPKVVLAKENERIGKIIDIMHETRYSQIPLVDDTGQFHSIISEMDIVGKIQIAMPRREVSKPSRIMDEVATDKPDLMAIPAIEFARHKRELITAMLSDTVGVISKKMAEGNVSDIIIVEEGIPTYIISVRDILEALMNTKAKPDFNIMFKGFQQLPEGYEKHYAEKLCSYYAEKIRYLLQNANTVSVHLKEYEKTGKPDKRHKYAIHLMVDYLGKKFVSTKAIDWDLARTVHKAFKDVETQISSHWRKDERMLKAHRPSGTDIPFSRMKGVKKGKARKSWGKHSSD